MDQSIGWIVKKFKNSYWISLQIVLGIKNKLKNEMKKLSVNLK